MTPKQALAEAKAALENGDLAEAMALYQLVLKSAPKHSAAGAALRKLQKQAQKPVTRQEVEDLAGLMQVGDLDRAEINVNALLLRAPNLAFLHLQKGVICGFKGLSQAALNAFERALELEPELHDARNNMAIALGDLGRFDEAIAACQASLSVVPDNAQVWLALSGFLLNAGQDDAALEAAKKATTLQPEFAQGWEVLANIHSSSGRKDAAIAALQKCLAAEPGSLSAQVELARLLGKDTAPQTTSALRDFLDQDGPGALEKSVVGFALADVLDKQGDTNAAFAIYAQANRLRSGLTRYDHGAEETLFEGQKQLFTGAGLPELPPPDPNLPRPIFIVGMNRSGTSLTEQILAGHSKVYGAGELDAVDRFAVAFPVPLAGISAPELAVFRDNYLGDMARRSDLPVFTDKMPVNYRWIGLILALFPDARIVAMTRNARDVCFSNFKASFGSSGAAYCYDMYKLAQNYALHLRYMDFWNGLYSHNIKTVSYEALVDAPQEQAQDLLKWLGLEWEPEVMEFQKLDRAVRTLSKGQVHQGIYRTAIQSWKPYESHLAPLFNALAELGVDSPP